MSLNTSLSERQQNISVGDLFKGYALQVIDFVVDGADKIYGARWQDDRNLFKDDALEKDPEWARRELLRFYKTTKDELISDLLKKGASEEGIMGIQKTITASTTVLALFDRVDGTSKQLNCDEIQAEVTKLVNSPPEVLDEVKLILDLGLSMREHKIPVESKSKANVVRSDILLGYQKLLREWESRYFEKKPWFTNTVAFNTLEKLERVMLNEGYVYHTTSKNLVEIVRDKAGGIPNKR